MFRQHGTAAGIGVFGLAGALIIAPAAAQAADPGPGTYAEGRFIAGTLAGSDLDRVLALDPATAVNDGSRPVAEERNPFSATALDAVTVDPGTVEVEGADGAEAGVIGQYAIARDDGTAYASSGLIGANGAIAVGPTGGAVAVVDLATLLGDSLPAGLTGLRLEAAGIAAEAEMGPDGHRGDYALAAARLVLDVPAIAATRDQAETTVTRLQESVLDLGGASGPLADAVDRVLAAAGLAGLADVDVSIDADLNGVLAALGDTVLRDDALTVDLAAGTATIDLAELPEGAGLADLEPGTELIGDGVLDDVVAGVQRLLGGWLDEVRLRLRAAIDHAEITVGAHAHVLDEVRTGDVVRTVTTPVTEIVDALTGQSLGTLDPATGAVTSTIPSISSEVLAELLLGTAATSPLSGLLGPLPTVTTRVTTTVSTVTEPAFSTLETAADVVVSGTLAGLRGGTAADASATAMLLGVPVQLDAALVVDGLGRRSAARSRHPGRLRRRERTRRRRSPGSPGSPTSCRCARTSNRQAPTARSPRPRCASRCSATSRRSTSRMRRSVPSRCPAAPAAETTRTRAWRPASSRSPASRSASWSSSARSASPSARSRCGAATR